MADNKRQHYVPQFYLRNFADREVRKFVALYNLPAKRFVARAPYASQSYKDYFYGADGKAEKLLGVIEGKAATVIVEVIARGRPPQRYTPAHNTLATFVVLQGARTLQAEAETIEAADKFAKLLLRHEFRDQPDLLAGLGKLRLTATNAVHLAIKQALRAAPMINDLRMKLLVNSTDTPFQTSDHPVVRLNSLYSDQTHRSVTGFANSGLQILLPLSPQHAVLFYDEDAYQIGEATSHVLRLSSPAHVRSINLLQWRYADQHIYFQPAISDAEVRELAAAIEGQRSVSRIEVTDEVLASDQDTHRVLMRMQGLGSAAIDLPRTRYLDRPQPLGEMTPLPMRHPGWVDGWHEILKAIDAGDLPPAAFEEYARWVPRPRSSKSR